MLKSVNRLKKETDFNSVLKTGQRANCSSFVAVYLENGLDITRVGVVVSKKVGGLAVKRNRIRRVVLSEMANMLREGYLKPGRDIVVRFVKAPTDLDNPTQLRAELRQCLGKLSLA